MTENEIATIIVDCAYQVHCELGPGLYESVYERCLAYELRERELSVKTQLPIAIRYKDLYIEEAFRADFVVNDLVLIEGKSVEQVVPKHKKQVITYLKLTKLRLGLLINFNEEYIKDGITRIVNRLEE